MNNAKKQDYTHTHTTVKQMKEWLNKYSDNDIVYLGSFNSLCGGGYYRLSESLIDIQDCVNKTKLIPYINDEAITEYEDLTELFERYEEDELLPEQKVAQQKNHIENNKLDWSEEKLKTELAKLEELKAIAKGTFTMGVTVPVIFINN